MQNEDVRVTAAIAAMQGYISRGEDNISQIVFKAFNVADAFVLEHRNHVNTSASMPAAPMEHKVF